MQYVKVTFTVSGEQESEVLMAILSDAGYAGFEETATELLAYTEEQKFDEDELKTLIGALGTIYHTEIIPAQNWNALWESNFEPVIVENFCTIQAHFHDIKVTTPYSITITPKMSFGTGHHATTQQMMLLMKDISFAGLSVLDFGTGTGVLAILAEMLGAKQVLAIDNDEWSVENAIENIERNNCKHIVVKIGSLEDVPLEKADVILANINRHILLQYLPSLYNRLNVGGRLLMSGLLVEDREIMLSAAANSGFHFKKGTEQLNWIALLFDKM